MGYFWRHVTNLEPKENTEIIGCYFSVRTSDPYAMFTTYPDGDTRVKLHGYTIYPSEELPPDCVGWSWKKVAALIWCKVSSPWKGKYIRRRRWVHYKLTGKFNLPSEERCLERFVLGVMKETHPNLYARISEWREE